MSFTVGLLFILLALAACGEPTKLIEIQDKALIVDVRTPSEFSKEHYAGAVNIPLSDVEIRLKDFGSKDTPIVVYCRSGRRSGIAETILKRAGYMNVVNGGGLRDMKKLKKK